MVSEPPFSSLRSILLPRPAWRLSLLVICAAALPAAELVMRDIGVGVVAPPTGFTYDVSSDAGDRSGSDSFGSAYGIDLHGRYSLARTGDSIGLVLGAALGAEKADYSAGGSFTAFSGTGLMGCGWAISDRLILLGEAQVGLGLGKLDLDASSSAEALSVSGPLIIGGVQASGHFALTESLVLALGVGWQETIAPLSGNGVNIDLKISGVTAFLSLDWRLSDRPFLLE